MNLPSDALNQIKVQFEEKPHCLVSLEVEVPLVIMQEEYEKAIKEINKEVSLPGFRKGKAPREYILAHFVKHVDKRWQDDLAKRAFDAGLKQTSLYPMDANSSIQCQWKRCSLKEPTALALFEYEILPKVPQVDYHSLAITQPDPITIDEAAIEKELLDLAARQSSWQPLDTDELAAGNWVELEVLDSDKKALYVGKRFEYSEFTMPKDLFEALQTLKKGEVKTCSLKKPGSQESVEASVEIKNILEKKAGEVNEQLAKNLGLESLEALRQRIEKNLRDSSSSDYRQQCFEAIQQALSSAYEFDVPKSALSYESRMQENALLSQLGKPENELTSDEKTQLQDQARQKAEAAIRQTFLLHKIASQEKIQIEDREVHQIMQPFMYELEKEKDQNRLRERFQNLYSRCRMHLIAEKALESVAIAKGWL